MDTDRHQGHLGTRAWMDEWQTAIFSAPLLLSLLV